MQTVDGYYVDPKGEKVSNFTIEIDRAVVSDGGDGGYVALARHESGQCERIFFLHWSAIDVPLECLKLINNGQCVGNNAIQFFLNIGPKQLRGLITSIAQATGNNDEVYQAARVIGKNKSGDNVVWIFNEHQALDQTGNFCNMSERGWAYVSHLLPRDRILPGYAVHRYCTTISEPLSNRWFDILCHFLKGDIYSLVNGEQRSILAATLSEAFGSAGLDVDATETDDINAESFRAQFFILASSGIISNYDVFMETEGQCPIIVGVGDPGCGKSKAGAGAIALTGAYAKFACSNFNDHVTKKLSMLSTQGMHLDDADSPKEVAAASKRYFDGGMDAQDTSFVEPRCAPLFTANYHVLDWLKKGNNMRYLDRLCLVPFPVRQQSKLAIRSKTLWSQRLRIILQHSSSFVGHLITFGEKCKTAEGQQLKQRCYELVENSFAHDVQLAERIKSSWVAVLMAVDEMTRQTTAIDSTEIHKYFKEVVVPFSQEHQLNPKKCTTNARSSPAVQLTPDELLENLVHTFELLLAPDNINLIPQCVKVVNDIVYVRCQDLESARIGSKLPDVSRIRGCIEANEMGKRLADQKFFSAEKNRAIVKSCLGLKASLFPEELIQRIVRVSKGGNVNAAAVNDVCANKDSEMDGSSPKSKSYYSELTPKRRSAFVEGYKSARRSEERTAKAPPRKTLFERAESQDEAVSPMTFKVCSQDGATSQLTLDNAQRLRVCDIGTSPMTPKKRPLEDAATSPLKIDNAQRLRVCDIGTSPMTPKKRPLEDAATSPLKIDNARGSRQCDTGTSPMTPTNLTLADAATSPQKTESKKSTSSRQVSKSMPTISEITEVATKPKKIKAKASKDPKSLCVKCNKDCGAMVCCDVCEQWWHLACANVKGGIQAAKARSFQCPGGCSSGALA